MVRGVAERSGNLRIRTARRLAITLLVLVIAGAIQALSFYQLFAPRVASASAATYALMLENSQRALYRQLAVDIEPWFDSTSGNEAEERTLAKAWSDFDGHFAAAPFEAIVALGEELPALLASAGADVARSDQIITQLERLQIIYTDTNKALLAELKRPPLYLWPIAPLAAERSGYRQAVTYNRALYLAQTGDIGTSRVMLAGLNASAEDPEVLAAIFYTLGRLQFELFRATSEVEYFQQSINYLRQALAAKPDLQLAQRLLDFLLSLPPAAAAPQAAEGRPERPAEGEGAAISAEKRIF